MFALAAAFLPAAGDVSSQDGLSDWPTYQHDQNRTGHAVTSLDQTRVRTLAPAWFFRTGDAVTAQPIKVHDTIYVGSWDGTFYAINATDGSQRWRFRIDRDQPNISPQPGEDPLTRLSHLTSDGGYITSSAIFVRAAGGRPDVVIFGGGYTLYALRAADGSLYWKHKYPGTGVGTAPRRDDDSRIFSSPAVVGNKVIFSVDADGSRGLRGYLVGADLRSGNPLWVREIDVDPQGRVLNDGCGNVWASPTIVASSNLEIVGVADCHFRDPPPYQERVLGVDIRNGAIRWVFKAPRDDNDCDFDFGATANLGVDARGRPTFLGVGGKDGTYYRIDPRDGGLLWQRRVVFGGFAGGFLGSTAFDGKRVYGATALGDFGRFEGFGDLGCDPSDHRDLPIQDPSVHAIATDGSVAWQGLAAQSFGATTVAGGMVFVGTGITREIRIYDAETGRVITSLKLLAPTDSGVVPSGDALFFGTGSSEQGVLDGVWAYTPLGAPPSF